MALQLVTPIIAQTMMACTQPFNYTYGAASREEHGKMRIGYTTILPNYEQNNINFIDKYFPFIQNKKYDLILFY